jgi:hypothetical protein
MKTKILLLLLLFVSFASSSVAELKHFLPRTNAVMSILDRKYWFDGDTIIDDKRYTKVYEQFCYSETECGDLQYYAAVREDTLAEKIYCIQVYDGVERLLADFDVKAGDMVTVSSYIWSKEHSYSAEIKDVDSIRIDNAYRKRINIVSIDGEYWGFPSDSWVEGIGSIVYGLFFPAPEVEIDAGDVPILLCLQVDNILVYQKPDYNTCYIKYSGNRIEYPKNHDFKIYPAITKNVLYVETDIQSCSYRIYNSVGAFVRSGIPDDNKVDVSMLNESIYYIVFYSENNQAVHAGKFIKHY